MRDELEAIYIFDFKTHTYETAGLSQTILENVKKDILNVTEKFGIQIEIKGIQSSEQFVKYFYGLKKYDVIRLTPHRGIDYLIPEIQNVIIQKLKEINEMSTEEIKNTLKSVGVPDFLVYNNKEIFFVEAKSMEDALHWEQVLWIFKYNFPVKLFYKATERQISKENLNIARRLGMCPENMIK